MKTTITLYEDEVKKIIADHVAKEFKLDPENLVVTIYIGENYDEYDNAYQEITEVTVGVN